MYIDEVKCTKHVPGHCGEHHLYCTGRQPPETEITGPFSTSLGWSVSVNVTVGLQGYSVHTKVQLKNGTSAFGNKCKLITEEKGIVQCRLVVLERYIAWSILEYNSVSDHRMCSLEYKLCKKMSESVQSCTVWRKHVPAHRLYCIARVECICSCDVGGTGVFCAHHSQLMFQ